VCCSGRALLTDDDTALPRAGCERAKQHRVPSHVQHHIITGLHGRGAVLQWASTVIVIEHKSSRLAAVGAGTDQESTISTYVTTDAVTTDLATNMQTQVNPWLILTTHNTHTHPFNGPLSGTTQVSRYQRGKTNLDFTEARDSEAVASAGPYASLHLAPGR